jgi:hypothetical protein
MVYLQRNSFSNVFYFQDSRLQWAVSRRAVSQSTEFTNMDWTAQIQDGGTRLRVPGERSESTEKTEGGVLENRLYKFETCTV